MHEIVSARGPCSCFAYVSESQISHVNLLIILHRHLPHCEFFFAIETVNGGAWQYFSAVCWFYGRNIYNKTKIPIGLVSSNWGGTPDEAWSSPDALKECTTSDKVKQRVCAGPNPHDPSVLWNAMINPLLNMSIYGAIWYQGEANAGNPTKYNCSFPAMINDWRKKWNEATNGDTDILFPFGFVQV